MQDEEYYNSGTLGGTCDPLCSVDETSSEDYQLGAKNAKSDIVKAVAIGAAVCIGAGAIQHSWVAEHQVSTGQEMTFCDAWLLVPFLAG